MRRSKMPAYLVSAKKLEKKKSPHLEDPDEQGIILKKRRERIDLLRAKARLTWTELLNLATKICGREIKTLDSLSDKEAKFLMLTLGELERIG